MFRPRVIPVLLLKGHGLVKTVRFKSEKYIGDPINAVRIFNDLEADELAFVDITATNENRTVSLDLVRQIGDEAFMPFAVGGGIKDVEHVRVFLSAGAEKVIINSEAVSNPQLIFESASLFGSQSIMVSIDVKKSVFGNYVIYTHSGKKKAAISLIEHLYRLEKSGAGEILINSIDNDGMMNGYDIPLIEQVSRAVSVPVIACGGAGTLEDFYKAFKFGNASAVAAGSRFVYHGPRNAVLINYPEKKELLRIFNR
jgi:cyclase